MKFTLLASFALLGLAAAAPTVELVERQTGNAAQNQAAFTNKCHNEVAGGEVYCCASQQHISTSNVPTQSAGLLSVLGLSGLLGGGANVPVGLNCNKIPIINVIPIQIGPLNLCGNKLTCCQSSPVSSNTQNVNGGLQLINLNGDLINVNNLCLASLL
ncbi:hypothetical protein B0O99DRAFT_742397 [Bisporella sp. PMI_857]|nr:hypothetical protein B0O99DRAFT_742397 [Bisporella sp. PMI_857]